MYLVTSHHCHCRYWIETINVTIHDKKTRGTQVKRNTIQRQTRVVKGSKNTVLKVRLKEEGFWSGVKGFDKPDRFSKSSRSLMENVSSPFTDKSAYGLIETKYHPGLPNLQQTCVLRVFEKPQIVQSMNLVQTDQCASGWLRRVTPLQHLPILKSSSCVKNIHTVTDTHTTRLSIVRV